jgi:hypothetical protein
LGATELVADDREPVLEGVDGGRRGGASEVLDERVALGEEIADPLAGGVEAAGDVLAALAPGGDQPERGEVVEGGRASRRGSGA